MKEVKITIPDNCELIKEGDSYVVKEKKNNPPRSWEEFCDNYPVKGGECYIKFGSIITYNGSNFKRNKTLDRNYCTFKEEAEAFLALMQLRQLRKAWVGDWEQKVNSSCGVILYDMHSKTTKASYDIFWCMLTLSFPTKEMAEDFLSCFKDLCETAKLLL